jgi:hypothetical protein
VESNPIFSPENTVSEAKHTHILTARPFPFPVDLWVSSLAWDCQQRGPLAGDQEREKRDKLADAIGDGVLAELLRSPRPIRVTAGPHGYTIEEL